MTAPDPARRGSLDLTRHRGAALAAAVALVVVVVAVVVLVGVVPFPELRSVAQAPEPPIGGDLAVIRYGDDGPCLAVVDERGAEREVACGVDVEGFGLHWVDGDHVGFQAGRAIGQQVVVDVATGEVDLEPAPDRLPDAAEEERRDREDEHGVLLVDGTVLAVRDEGGRRDLVTLDGPSTYVLLDARWTADGSQAVVLDSRGQVLVVPAEGGPARVWARDVGEWAIP